ncbi:MAG: ABC transporter permease, partial [Clostridiales bacterium]|nr:ABC transporter permease [Clostridiales bacterium]
MKNSKSSLKIGTVITGVVVLLLIVGFFFTPYDPEAMDVSNKLSGVSLRHIMGCDHLGRDIFSRILSGLRTTFFMGTATVLIGGFFGTLLGAICGYFGGLLDEILMRLNDAVFAFPSILLALVFIGIFGTGKYN